MPAELSSPSLSSGRESDPVVVKGSLRCALTGRPLSSEEAYWAPPLVTVGELVSTLFQTLISAPGNLGHVLLGEQPNVPYAPEARQQLATRRTTEQLKLLGLLIVIAALFIVPIVLLVA